MEPNETVDETVDKIFEELYYYFNDRYGRSDKSDAKMRDIITTLINFLVNKLKNKGENR